MATVSAFYSFADWCSYMEETWSDEGYFPMGMVDEDNDLGNHDDDEIAIKDPEEISTEQMLQYIEKQFMYYPYLLEDYEDDVNFNCSVTEEDPRPINFLDAEDVKEILNVSREEAEFLDEEFEAALDSGAGDHVASSEPAPCYTVEQSSGSRSGQHFIGAGGHRMKNQGQMRLALRADNGKRGKDIRVTVQAAKVTRPLLSVSKICDNGMKVIFDDELATIYDRDGREVCRFHRSKGLYIAKMKIRNPAFKRKQPFTRPAVK